MATELEKEKPLEVIKEMLNLSARTNEGNYVNLLNELIRAKNVPLLEFGLENASSNISTLSAEKASKVFELLTYIDLEESSDEMDALILAVCESYWNSKTLLPKGVGKNLTRLLLLLFSDIEYRDQIAGILRYRWKFQNVSNAVIRVLVDYSIENSVGFDNRTDILTVLDSWKRELERADDIQANLINAFKVGLDSISKDSTKQTEQSEEPKTLYTKGLLNLINGEYVNEAELKTITSTAVDRINPNAPPIISLVFRVFDKLEPGEEAFDDESAKKMIESFNVFNRVEDGVNLLGRIIEVSGLSLLRKKPGLTMNNILLNYPGKTDVLFNKSIRTFFKSASASEYRKIIGFYVRKALDEPAQLGKISLLLSNGRGLFPSFRFNGLREKVIELFYENETVSSREDIINILSVIKGPDYLNHKPIFSIFEELLTRAEKQIYKAEGELALKYIPVIYSDGEPPKGKRTVLRSNLFKLIGKHRNHYNDGIRNVFLNLPKLLESRSARDELRKIIKLPVIRLTRHKRKTYETFFDFTDGDYILRLIEQQKPPPKAGGG